jgi:O-antigen ligase
VTATAVAGRLEARKGSLTAPLSFLALAFASLGSHYGIVALWAAAALSLGLIAALLARRPFHWSWPAISATAYAVLVAASVLFLGPAYSPAGLYHPLLFLGAYWIIRGFDAPSERAAILGALAVATVLAAWGMLQVGAGMQARATALFETPATYAAVLSLLGLPVVISAMLVGGRTRLPVLAAILFAGLMLADSRGALLGLAAGIGCALVLAVRANLLRLRVIAFATVILGTAFLLSAGLRALVPASAPDAPAAELRSGSAMSRLELYALSLEAWRERPLAGTGYLTFRYTLEQGRAKVPSYGDRNETWFVHNDYLQTLQELGPAGLMALLGITLLPLLLAYRRLPALPAAERPAAIACCAALAAMAAHALVDFPFYVPVCLLLYGALLGALDRRLGSGQSAPAGAWTRGRGFRAARAGAIALLALVLLRPVAAEAAAHWGLRKLSQGESLDAAVWLGVASRIDALDWRYHWYVGQFWDTQTLASGKPEAANLAARAYEAGYAANPLEVKSLLGMISVHRRYRHLLDGPADPGTLRVWAERAAALAPFDPGVAEVRSP